MGHISLYLNRRACLHILKQNLQINKPIFFKIIDPPNSQSLVTNEILEKNHSTISALHPEAEILTVDLLCSNQKIFDIIEKIKGNINSGNLIIDISTFPKRFFFPIIKQLLKFHQLQNLVITYTTPKEYSGEELSFDPEMWNPLPFFVPGSFEERVTRAIVGVGFMPFGLPKLLKEQYSEIPVSFFFPIPPGPPNYQRTWKFMEKIEQNYSFKSVDRIERINAIDVTDTFNRLCFLTNFGEERVLMAPYGPKPISLAMCLFACITNSPVYYTQPRRYNPEYSKGVETILAYCIKINGKTLYTLEK